MLRIGIDHLEEVYKKCKEFNRDMSTQIKWHYNVKENKLRGKYCYDLIYSHDDSQAPADIFLSWFEEVKNQNENRNDFI